MQYIEMIGWVSALAAVFIVFVGATKGLFGLVLGEARQGREVDFEGILECFARGLEKTTVFFFQKKRVIGTVLAIATFVLTSQVSSISAYAALGCAVITLVIVGFITPAVLSQSKLSLGSTFQALKQRSRDS